MSSNFISRTIPKETEQPPPPPPSPFEISVPSTAQSFYTRTSAEDALYSDPRFAHLVFLDCQVKLIPIEAFHQLTNLKLDNGNNCIVNSSSQLFSRYVEPFLRGERETINIETQNDLLTCFEELKRYGIAVSDADIVRLHRRVPLDDAIQTVFDYFRKKLNSSGEFKRTSDAKTFDAIFCDVCIFASRYYHNNDLAQDIIEAARQKNTMMIYKLNYLFNQSAFYVLEHMRKSIKRESDDNRSFISINLTGNLNINASELVNGLTSNAPSIFMRSVKKLLA